MAPLPPSPRQIEPHAAGLLREAAARAGFDGRVYIVLGMVGSPGWKGAMRARLSGLPTPACGVLARFFMIGDDVSQFMLEPALGGPEVLVALERAGIAAPAGDGIWRCPFLTNPAGGVLAFSDPIGDPPSESPPDEFILPVSLTTRFVDALAVREPCELAIDLGCGQGYLALRSLAHAHRCIASDINPRALEFTRTNASLNGAGLRIECRQGSFFEPMRDVAGQIDLITSNPPFIILPGEHVTALSSSWEGDGMLEHLARTTPEMLRDGGWATVIGLWEHADPSDWVSRIREWTDGSGCDALALQFRTYRPDEYFQQWFSPQVRAASEPGWRALCQRRRIGAITYGGLVLRKRPGPNWLRPLYTLINIRSGVASVQLRALFDTQTALQSIPSPAALLDRRLRIAPGWRFDPTQLPGSVPAGASFGLALPCPHAARYEPILAAFQGTAVARQTLTHLRQSGQVAADPEDPATTESLHWFVTNGCLDIVD